jgi:hypothetical protein
MRYENAGGDARNSASHLQKIDNQGNLASKLQVAIHVLIEYVSIMSNVALTCEEWV